jgi:hypothetical protein
MEESELSRLASFVKRVRWFTTYPQDVAVLHDALVELSRRGAVRLCRSDETKTVWENAT